MEGSQIHFATLLFSFLLCLKISGAQDVKIDNSTSFQNKILKQVNRFRTLHSVKPLKLDSSLSQSAVKWALVLHKKSRKKGFMKTWFAHPKHQGECVYTEASSENPENITGHIHQAVISWYCEILRFNFSRKRFREETGQFTQMVWKGTHRAGFARLVNEDTGDVAIVARFSPMGNWHYKSDFNKNVNEPLSYEETKECPQKKAEFVETTTKKSAKKAVQGRGLGSETTTKKSIKKAIKGRGLGLDEPDSGLEATTKKSIKKAVQGRGLGFDGPEENSQNVPETTTEKPKKKKKEKEVHLNNKKAKTIKAYYQEYLGLL